jgi:phage gpG-like protein
MATVSFHMTGTKEVTHDLTRFRQNVTRAKPVFAAMAEHVAGMQRDQFQTEGRHYGPGWATLDPKYRKWKEKRRPGRKILVFNGDLKDAAAPTTARGFDIYRVSDKGMEVGVSYTQTPHAKFHQEGTAKMRPRTIMARPTKADQKALTKILHTHIVKGTSVTGGTR